MKPRILLLMDDETWWHISPLHSKESPYTFVRYIGRFNSGIEGYLDSHAGEFDAVAVMDNDGYKDVRDIVQRRYQGPKILIKCFEQAVSDGDYTLEVTIPFTISEFDRLVEKHFAKL